MTLAYSNMGLTKTQKAFVNSLSESITKSGLQDVVRRIVAKCEQYIGLYTCN